MLHANLGPYFPPSEDLPGASELELAAVPLSSHGGCVVSVQSWMQRRSGAEGNPTLRVGSKLEASHSPTRRQ
jgi:hypothetical protein